ncbi:hypothetical protein [Bartonella harrusi]|uniref:Phage related protein n=1 Tax=Bartonella harrusi TaxID=2961895 RepID=A0ABY5EWE8_9HYPH|nr:hypothetical protein [Bartonella harrusi]UTO27820.1 hypothetical protein NMK50_06105 [Bartonella harrusi]UTO28728.1 hypothetical protein NMK50_01540 [Bartonella harrusi]
MKEPPFLWLPGQKPSIAEAERITSLANDALKKLENKATEEEIQTTYLVLSNGLKSPSEYDEKSTALAYFYTLDGISSWALQTATKNALRGKAEGLNATFMPSTADFYRYCEQLESNIHMNIDYLVRSLQKPEIQDKGKEMPLTPEGAEKFEAELSEVLKGLEDEIAK